MKNLEKKDLLPTRDTVIFATLAPMEASLGRSKKARKGLNPSAAYPIKELTHSHMGMAEISGMKIIKSIKKNHLTRIGAKITLN